VALVIGSVALWQPDSLVWLVALLFFVLPLGMGNVMAPGTEAVMSAVPEAKAGVGSAMNDLNQQVAGALGVAVIGSVSSSLYSSRVETATTGRPHEAAHAASDSIGGAAGVAAHLPAGAGDALAAGCGRRLHDALGLALLVGSGVALAGAVLVKRYLPDRRTQRADEPQPGRGPRCGERASESGAPPGGQSRLGCVTANPVDERASVVHREPVRERALVSKRIPATTM
jgi:hypothetical protein